MSRATLGYLAGWAMVSSTAAAARIRLSFSPVVDSWHGFPARGLRREGPIRPAIDDPALVPSDQLFRWSQVAPPTAPSTITAPMAMNQVSRLKTTPIVP